MELKIPSADDLMKIAGLLQKMHEGIDWGGRLLPAFDLNKVLNALGLSMQENMCCVLQEDAQIVGVLAIVRTPPWFSEERILNNIVLYVTPEFRSIKTAGALLNAGKQLAEIHELPLMIGESTMYEVEGMEDLFVHYGFVKTGVNVVYLPRGKKAAEE